jgi:DNA-binding NarL/FixJ family response regulator
MRAAWRVKSARKRIAARGRLQQDRFSQQVDEIAVERATAGDPVRLTIRERSVAVRRLLRHGLTSRAIAERLHLSTRTVERYRAGTHKTLAA